MRELAPGLEWLAGWELSSENYHFGGFSALIAREDGSIFAGTDRSRLMIFAPEDHEARPARFDWLHDVEKVDRSTVDLEALYEDPDTGTFWAAFERKNVIMRFNSAEKLTGWRAPEQMQSWSYNAGAEAMTRLSSDEFLIVPEGPHSWFSEMHQALVYEGDPVDDLESVVFEIAIGGGFRPVDAATLPDGHIMLLLRKFSFGFPPTFESALMIGRLTQSDDAWTWQTDDTLPLAGPIPPENYEGLAVVPRDDGAANLWLISDNNMSVRQHTYLIKLRWQPKEKARGAAAR